MPKVELPRKHAIREHAHVWNPSSALEKLSLEAQMSNVVCFWVCYGSPELPKGLKGICLRSHGDSIYDLGYIPELRTFGSSGFSG